MTHIQLGAARVAVRGLLAGDEDQPRPLRAFPDDFADAGAAAPEAGSRPWLAGLAAALVGGGVLAFLRRRRARRRAVRAEPATVLARLAELERGLDGASGPERCYALTRLLREAGDALAREPRAGLTDEEWLAATHASLEVPRGVVAELAAVFERAARVKYGGEAPTSWALQETFGRARAALEALAGGAARP